MTLKSLLLNWTAGYASALYDRATGRFYLFAHRVAPPWALDVASVGGNVAVEYEEGPCAHVRAMLPPTFVSVAAYPVAPLVFGGNIAWADRWTIHSWGDVEGRPIGVPFAVADGDRGAAVLLDHPAIVTEHGDTSAGTDTKKVAVLMSRLADYLGGQMEATRHELEITYYASPGSEPLRRTIELWSTEGVPAESIRGLAMRVHARDLRFEMPKEMETPFEFYHELGVRLYQGMLYRFESGVCVERRPEAEATVEWLRTYADPSVTVLTPRLLLRGVDDEVSLVSYRGQDGLEIEFDVAKDVAAAAEGGDLSRVVALAEETADRERARQRDQAAMLAELYATVSMDGEARTRLDQALSTWRVLASWVGANPDVTVRISEGLCDALESALGELMRTQIGYGQQVDLARLLSFRDADGVEEHEIAILVAAKLIAAGRMDSCAVAK